MKKLASAFLLVFVAGCTHSQPAEESHLEREVDSLRRWTGDMVLVRSIKAQNDQHLTLGEIQRRDAEWSAGKAQSLINAVTTGDCSDRLRQLAAEAPHYSEILLMDNQGALVCSTHRASDYWQGDEAKWTRTFNDGKGAIFIDRPRVDASANERLAQISLPFLDSGTVIGAITVGIRFDETNR